MQRYYKKDVSFDSIYIFTFFPKVQTLGFQILKWWFKSAIEDYFTTKVIIDFAFVADFY